MAKFYNSNTITGAFKLSDAFEKIHFLGAGTDKEGKPDGLDDATRLDRIGKLIPEVESEQKEVAKILVGFFGTPE
jgi:hypothetical protein